MLAGGVLTLGFGSPGVARAGQGGRPAGVAGRRRASVGGRFSGLWAGYLACEGDLPAVALPAVAHEGRRVFWRLRFACCCAINIMECGSIVRALPAEEKASVGKGVLFRRAVAPNKRLHADGFASLRSARRR